MGFTCSVVVNRWIRRRNPVLNLFSQLIAWNSPVSVSYHDATKKNERFILFKSSDIFCISTGTYSQIYSFTDPSLSYQELFEYWILMPLYLKDKVGTLKEMSSNVSVPFMTTFMFLSRPQTTSMVCVAVLRDSSTVSRSNLCNTASISFSPRNFCAYFSVSPVLS